MVRVTSGRGKHMQLVVTSGVECDWKTFRVSYVSDIVTQNAPGEDFAIKIEKMYATQIGQGAGTYTRALGESFLTLIVRQRSDTSSRPTFN